MGSRAALLRWTGRGRISDLQGSVEHILRERRGRADVYAVGGTLVVRGNDPVGTCLLFEHLPGVAWTAAGYSGKGVGELAKSAALLAENYLKRGTKFTVEAEVTHDGPPSDLAGAVMASMLGKAKGARASGRSPKHTFRAAMDGAQGAVGVEVTRGPGGAPVGDETVTCLVSGGAHSSVVAWNAMLSGYRVDLVHAESGEASLLAAAKLYAELSYRGDPRSLSLTVLEGGGCAGMIASHVASAGSLVFAGFRPACPVPGFMRGMAEAPLYLLSEEAFDAQFRSLKLKAHVEKTDWNEAPAQAYGKRSFGGKAADVSGVLDALA
ncbi:MAG: hypothetical protein JRM73_03190 [Nitrososphaerota archaeon]|nr:hypothetical protein [Nitrososphaerota archaeon]